MSAAFIKTKVLPSGHSIPAVALGVYQSEPGAETYDAVVAALKLGYRHIDTATVYRNEVDVGKAIRDSGVPRQDVFVTSKIVAQHNRWSYDDVVAGVRLSNSKLGLEYIDLYLLHAPFDGATRAEAWKALEDMQAEGVVRDIGVSNFGELHLQKLAQTWRVKPAVNQVELHPWLARADTVKYCEEQGILMEAYSPLARAQKMHDRTLKQVASEVGATSAQVLIAWSLAKGFVTLPKSVTESRIKENLEAAKVELSSEQMDKLNGLDAYFVTAWDPIKHHAA
ncbi:putative oxidoreductase C2F3.05c [Phytophthora citrophthora]|uniref:Oxidoreductase C2F3.05c n=1 Tax=Phytophthora citrophthora TaxID=4793 RepID=A0AAD9LQ39_9STRA|nr:putative oxidoreductase C2F3.05c [Phytophthora citrophthora]